MEKIIAKETRVESFYKGARVVKIYYRVRIVYERDYFRRDGQANLWNTWVEQFYSWETNYAPAESEWK